MEQLLSDVKVLDLTHHISGPYCTKLFADYGADVIKAEKPDEGDEARRMGPFAGGVPHPEKSGLFLHLNTNKRGITLNLKSATGKIIFKELVKWADILVESFRPGVMSGLGLEYRILEKINPTLVMTSISNFGQTGPYRHFKASEIIISGMGHSMHTQGAPEREPVKMGGNLMQYQSGLMAAVATMMAFLSSELQGVGQQVDVSLMETHLGSIDRRAMSLIGHTYNPTEVTERIASCIGLGFPIGNYPCKDGYFSIAGGVLLGFWERTVKMMDMPELLEDSRFCTVESQKHLENYEAFLEIFLPWCMEHTVKEIISRGQSYRCLVAPVYTAEGLVNDPHMVARDSFAGIDHPIAHKVKYPCLPFRANDSLQIRRPAPLLGQHNGEVYGQMGYSKEDLVKLRETGVI